jgi:hypothetical protein
MLSTKEIAVKLDIPITTLYGWKKDDKKRKIYNYLANADDQYEKYRKVNIILEEYIRSTKLNLFSYEEIEYIFNLDLNISDDFDTKNIHLYFINKTQKSKIETTDFILNISNKLASLNVIEKYIFCDRLQIVSLKIKNKKEEKVEILKHYFKEFLEI